MMTMWVSTTRKDVILDNANICVAQFQNKGILYSDELDAYQAISISNNCSCVINVTKCMIIQVELKSAISNIARIIAPTLASNDFFG